MPASLPGRSKTRPQDPEALSALSSLKFPQLVPMKGEHGGGGGEVSREEVVIQTGPRLCWALGKCQAPPLTFPLPPNEGSKDTQAQGTQTATEMDICKIPAHAPMTPLPSAFLPSPWEMKERAGRGGSS